jgi:hypothetical protein
MYTIYEYVQVYELLQNCERSEICNIPRRSHARMGVMHQLMHLRAARV